MSDILTITLNPALDMSTAVDAVVPEDKLRCATPVLDPGGGGINVARAILRNGGAATAFVALAGFRGQQFAALLKAEGVAHITSSLSGETRLSLAVSDLGKDTQYRFVMPGPTWTPDDVQSLRDQLETVIKPNMQVVLSGSQPPGVPDDFAVTLSKLTRGAGAFLTLDTSGPPLKTSVALGGAAPDVLRLDGAESAALAGKELPTIEDVAGFARDLVLSGRAQMVVSAMGANGSVLATHDEVLHAVTPPVTVVSKVGAGDSFVGLFTLARANGADWKDALCHGTAAASAAVMSPATELCRASDVRELLTKVKITKL